jgi:hypothetical protein
MVFRAKMAYSNVTSRAEVLGGPTASCHSDPFTGTDASHALRLSGVIANTARNAFTGASGDIAFTHVSGVIAYIGLSGDTHAGVGRPKLIGEDGRVRPLAQGAAERAAVDDSLRLSRGRACIEMEPLASRTGGLRTTGGNSRNFIAT